MVEPVRQHFQHKCLRERGYVFEKIFVGAGTIWLGIVQQGRGRDEDYSSPPARIPACAANAPGLYEDAAVKGVFRWCLAILIALGLRI